MNSDDLDLRSVNWSQGMFLTPDHFLQQERYLDSMFLWILRYALPSHGLIGGGPRVDATERGAARYDPVVEIDDAGDTLKITVTQCRGLTPGGNFVDTSWEGYQLAQQVSAWSLIGLAKGAAPLMEGREAGIVCLSYYGAEKVVPNYNVMGVAKAALEASTRYLANDLGPQGVRVNAISPGPMRTLAGSAGRFRLIRIRFHSLWPRIGGTVARFDGTISFALYY